MWRLQHLGRPYIRFCMLVPGLNERDEGVLGIRLAEAGLVQLSASTNIDVSQAVDRTRLRPFCPTVTPNAKSMDGTCRCHSIE